MPQPIRVFIAAPIPRALTVFLKNIQARLRSPRMDVRWLAAENIHLTLKFLGNIERSRVSAVGAQMDVSAGQTGTFRLHARGIGVFPNRRHPRVLWVGLGGELDRLVEVQAVLESNLESVGFGKESRRFHPHLTIGRIRHRIDARILGASLDSLEEIASDSFRVERLALIKSDLKPAGAEYSLLHTSQLAV
jgi:2'-5' RNA ligase